MIRIDLIDHATREESDSLPGTGTGTGDADCCSEYGHFEPVDELDEVPRINAEIRPLKPLVEVRERRAGSPAPDEDQVGLSYSDAATIASLVGIGEKTVSDFRAAHARRTYGEFRSLVDLSQAEKKGMERVRKHVYV